jgi:hypothetical protein
VRLCQGYKEEPLSAILCLRVCSVGVSTCLHPLDQEKITLSRFSMSCVSVFGTGGLLLPTIWGFVRDITFRPGRGALALPRGDMACCLVAAAPRFG